MKHYKNMSIGVTVDKSGASVVSESIYLPSTPYINSTQSAASISYKIGGLKRKAQCKSISTKSIFKWKKGK